MCSIHMGKVFFGGDVQFWLQQDTRIFCVCVSVWFDDKNFHSFYSIIIIIMMIEMKEEKRKEMRNWIIREWMIIKLRCNFFFIRSQVSILILNRFFCSVDVVGHIIHLQMNFSLSLSLSIHNFNWLKLSELIMIQWWW